MPVYLLLRPVYFILIQALPPTTTAVHLRSLLPLDYEWVFIDGPAECDVAPGVAAFCSAPYLCWYTTSKATKMDLAPQLISSVILNDDPFDAVMAFSQVSSGASAVIYLIS